MAGPIIHAFDADGTPSEGALIALEKWCRECVAERVQEIIDNGHYVQWYGDAPPDNGSFLRYNSSENMWDSVSADDMRDLLGVVPGSSSTGSTSPTTPVGDLVVNSPNTYGNYPISGTSITSPDAFGNYNISSTGVTGPDAFGNYALASN